MCRQALAVPIHARTMAYAGKRLMDADTASALRASAGLLVQLLNHLAVVSSRAPWATWNSL